MIVRSLPSWWFGTTIFLSAFLLFLVQPMIGKIVLPWFGGSASVWTMAMLFFQLVLFLGYLMAERLNRWLSIRHHVWFYLGLFLVAAWSLPILPSESWKPTNPDHPGWKVLALLLVTVGTPYLLLSTTGPMTQAWFSRLVQDRRVYRLYALSNAGSLLALLAYPFVVEPMMSLRTQAFAWSGLFVVYCIAMYGCARLVRDCGSRHAAEGMESGGEDQPAEEVLVSESAWRRWMGWTVPCWWVVLPMIASVALLATTNYVCQDIASIPLLWIVPLSLYLVSLILCFDRPLWYRPIVMSVGAIAFAALASSTESFSPLATLYGWLGWNRPKLPEGLAWLWYRQVHFSTKFVIVFLWLFLACMVLHGETYRLRPAARSLTRYYLCLAAGGALGGIFVNWVAPQMFSQYYEWGLSLGVVIAVSLVVLVRSCWVGLHSYSRAWRRWALVICMLILAPFVAHAIYWVGKQANRRLSSDTIFAERNFYGAYRVSEEFREDPDRHVRTLIHGIIKHGQQYMSSDLRYYAGSYYSPGSGVALAMEELSQRRKKVAVVGLGAGSLAAYAGPGDEFVFYEINPRIEHVANTYFTYLADARERGAVVRVELGDARLSMERQSSQGFDLIVVDAFSGDSIPVHLLTQEAMDVYARHMLPDSMLVFHVSNTYLNLVPVTFRLAEYAKLDPIHIKHRSEPALGSYTTDYVILTGRKSFVRRFPRQSKDDDSAVGLWTDHASNLLQILKL